MRKIPLIAKIYLVLAVLFLLVPPVMDIPRGQTGNLLVSTGDIRTEPFFRSVVHIQRHSWGGAFGLILNTPLPETERATLPPALKDSDLPIYSGGPVGQDHFFVMRLNGEDLEITELETALQRDPNLLKPPHPENLRIYKGYSGWGWLQLDMELIEGRWESLPNRKDYLFAPSPHRLWNRAYQDAVKGRPLKIRDRSI